jgi:predicted nucleic acid-binding protein
MRRCPTTSTCCWHQAEGRRIVALRPDEDVILKWRLLVEDGRKRGHTFSQPDLFIAATALEHGLTVVTRDAADYAAAGAAVFNPWKDTTSP